MKKRLAVLLLLLACLAGVSFHQFRAQAHRVANSQMKSAHMIAMLSASGRKQAVCSATAIGPHALLTAEHCIEDDPAMLNVDLSTVNYQIVADNRDNRDHVILIVDGPAFKYIAPVFTRAPRVGEPTFIYGFGHAQYPVTSKPGFVIEQFDPSDVDEAEGMFYTTNKIIPGDSGSAIYGADGAILGLVTYGMSADDASEDATAAGFQLNFDPKAIKVAQTYTGE